MGLFCKHDWKVLDKTVLESAWEQMAKGMTKCGHGEMPLDGFQKKVVITLTCTKCGELHVVSEANPTL